jgi:hypothetical protein
MEAAGGGEICSMSYAITKARVAMMMFMSPGKPALKFTSEFHRGKQREL